MIESLGHVPVHVHTSYVRRTARVSQRIPIARPFLERRYRNVYRRTTGRTRDLRAGSLSCRSQTFAACRALAYDRPTGGGCDWSFLRCTAPADNQQQEASEDHGYEQHEGG